MVSFARIQLSVHNTCGVEGGIKEDGTEGGEKSGGNAGGDDATEGGDATAIMLSTAEIDMPNETKAMQQMPPEFIFCHFTEGHLHKLRFLLGF